MSMSNATIAGLTFVGLTTLLIGTTPPMPANAQTPVTVGVGVDLPSKADVKSFTEWRIGVIKDVLQLTPEQVKLWQPIEDAIRSRADARYTRLAARVNSQRDRDPIERLNDRADAVAQRAAGLKTLASAWQPLYQSLESNQKLRLRFLSALLLREMRDAVESRRLQADDEDEDF